MSLCNLLLLLFWIITDDNFSFYLFTATIDELEQKLMQLKLANQKLERNSRGSVFESVQDNKAYIQRASPGGRSADAIVEETTLIRSRSTTNAAMPTIQSCANTFIVVPLSIVLLMKILLH